MMSLYAAISRARLLDLAAAFNMLGESRQENVCGIRCMACATKPDSCKMLFEVGELKRFAYLLLAVILSQLSGLGMMCAPRTASRHSCCTTPEERSPVNRSSLPDCCLVSLLNYQGSITEVQGPRFDSHSARVIAKTPAVALPPEVSPFNADRRPSLHSSLSPPLSPLLQTCLLLI